MIASIPNPKTIYCHGLPGSAREIDALIPKGCSQPTFLNPLGIKGFDEFIDNHSPRSVHLIGFSLGAMTAIKTAAQRPKSVKKITLISPAAPLELGDFLPEMAGRPVFKAAKSGDFFFKAFTASQRLGVAVTPGRIIEAMFKHSPKADIDLLLNPAFKASLIEGLKYSLGPGRADYHRAVRRYVEPWADWLLDVKCPVVLHHGTADNWAPLEMSQRLREVMRCDVRLITHEGLGHYSALHHVLPGILANLSILPPAAADSRFSVR